MATTSGLMTVADFWSLPEDPASDFELHHGELVKVSRPKKRHTRRQRRLRQLLEPLLVAKGIVETELPFRALSEYDLRVADVAFVTHERWDATDDDDTLRGAPDIVIEVLSPSNTVAEMAERRALCLENGSRQFWIVDNRRQEIDVSTPDGVTRTYKSGESILLPVGEGKSIAVDSVFAAE